MAVCCAILRGQQIYTVVQAVHSLLYIVAKCNFFSVVIWKYIIQYLQKCEGCSHFREIQYIYIYILEMHWCIGQKSVSTDKSYLFHYRPSVDCSKSADDQGRLYPVNQKAAKNVSDCNSSTLVKILCLKQISVEFRMVKINMTIRQLKKL